MSLSHILEFVKESQLNEFLATKSISPERSIQEFGIGENKRKLYVLTEELVNRQIISLDEVLEFFYSKILKGSCSNIYLNNFMGNPRNDSDISSFYTIMSNSKITVPSDLNCLSALSNLTKEIPINQRELLHVKYDTTHGKYSRIVLIIGEGTEIKESHESRNTYHVIDIDYLAKQITMQIKNNVNNAYNYNSDKIHKNLLTILSHSLLFRVIPTDGTKYGVFNLLNDMTTKTLDKVSSEIDSETKKSVISFVDTTFNPFFESKGIHFLDENNIILKNSILNSFYKTYYISKYGKLNPLKLKDEFDIFCFPQTVLFSDETLAFGKARSDDPNVPLYNNSVFYDIKARFEESKEVQYARICWIDIEPRKIIATSLHNIKNHTVKIVFHPHNITKEMFDYVLSKIKHYIK